MADGKIGIEALKINKRNGFLELLFTKSKNFFNVVQFKVNTKNV